MQQAQDPVSVQNFLALRKKEFEIKFDLTNSNYDPVETIGTGAYGVVCSAVHRKTKDRVAIKKIPDIFNQDTIAKRTLREVKILKHFKHDNVISIREILKPCEQLDKFKDIYIVFDLMESDMHKVIHSKQDISDEHIRYFIYQILRGLKYIHSANVIHRDLKPSNLLVNENCDLKIGDFGMARGVSSDPDEYKHLLTQYVATRWYRAPEIMMAQVAYSGAVDMWSVGCILGEMLGRTQIFPGRDFLDQLKLIIGIVGSPSKEFLNLVQSPNMRNFITNKLGNKKPESFRKLYPKAKNKAIQLLEKMLVLDPNKRMVVEDALKHPYFSTYHDPDDEPICIPAFDFSFETQDLTSSQLKDGIVKEIMDFHKTKPTPPLKFDFRPVPKSELLKTPSPKVLHAAGKPDFTRPDKDSYENKAAQGKAEVEGKKLKNFAEPAIKTESLQPTDTDIEMLSAKMSGTKIDDKEGTLKGSTGVTTHETKNHPNYEIKTQALEPSDTDIQMLSAKLSAARVEDKTAVDNEVRSKDIMMSSLKRGEPSIQANKEEPKVVNAKEALKMALLKARLAKQTGEEKKRPVTALQKQRENEERKKKRLEKAKEKKKKQKEKESPMKLSSDDLQMLERWKNMQSTKGKQDSKTASNSAAQIVAPSQLSIGQNVVTQVTVPQAFSVQPPTAVLTLPDFNATVSSNNISGNVIGNPQQCTTQTVFQPQSVQSFTPQTVVSSAAKEPPSYSEAIFGKNSHQPSFGFPTLDSQNGVHLQQQKERTLPPIDLGKDESFNPYSEGMKHLSPSDLLYGSNHTPLVEVDHLSEEKRSNPQVQGNFLPPEVFMPASTANPNPESVLLPQGSDFNRHHDRIIHKPEPQAPLPMFTNTALTGSSLQGAATNQSVSEIPADFLSFLSKAGKTKSDELTVHTPKGSGAGYGVGLDLDAILADSQPQNETRLDSAPLSASLIQDWMDMTGNLDSKDLENLELEIGLPMGFNDLV